MTLAVEMGCEDLVLTFTQISRFIHMYLNKDVFD